MMLHVGGVGVVNQTDHVVVQNPESEIFKKSKLNIFFLLGYTYVYMYVASVCIHTAST